MRRCGAMVLGALVAAACATPAPTMVRDLSGRPCDPLVVAPGSVHVLVFTSHECPIANAYAPTLADLAGQWRQQPVHLFVVHVDPDLDAAAARRHATDYALPGTVLLDPAHTLARSLGITRTPEAAVLTTAGLAYRGRIDDQWHALGARADVATRHDLADAVAAACAGRRVASPRTPVVGCLLPEPLPPVPPGRLRFANP